MNNRSLFLIAVAVVVVGLYFFNHRSQQADSAASEETLEEAQEVVKKTNTEASATASQDSTVVVNSGSVNNAAADTSLLSEVVLKKFSQHIVQLEKCLQLTSAGAEVNSLAPTPENLLARFRGTLGEAIVQLDDWSQFDIVDKSGQKKRIRVDYDYPDGVTPNRRLSMYTLNSYGSYEIDNLTNDQSDNPNEAYIESLKEGQRLQQEEKATRIYFSQGEELVLGLKNNRLDSLNISRGANTYNCTNLSLEVSSCSCSE